MLERIVLTLFYERKKRKTKNSQISSPRKACDDKAVINLSAKSAWGIHYKPQIKMGSQLQLSINVFRKEMLHGSKLGILY